MIETNGLRKKNEISLSVCIITKNEQKNLPNCLKSVQWAPEVIVLDDFSADDTHKICKSFDNVRYVQNRFTGFGIQKNCAIAYAKGDWILNIDADEEVSSELKREIITVTNIDSVFAAYTIRRKNLWFGRYYSDNYPGALRLFKRGNGKFSNAHVHEKVKINGSVGQLEGILLHKPTSHKNFIEHYKTYGVKYGKLAGMDYYQRGERITVVNAFWKIILLPVTAFFRDFVIKRKIMLGKTGFYLSLCSSICYHIGYLNLLRIQREVNG